MKYLKNLKSKLKEYKIKIDDRDNYSPGWKFNEWELKGIPFRIEIGEKEVKQKKLTLAIRDIGKKKSIHIKDISKMKKLGEDFDKRLIKKADKIIDGRIVNCKTIENLKIAMKKRKIARVNFCSVEKEGLSCAENIEKEINAEVRGTMANKKEKPSGKCIICNKPAKEIVYIGKSY